MSYKYGPSIVTDGLVFYVDAANENSYLGSGTTWTDLAGSDDGTLTNGPTFDSGNGGSIAFDGSNDYVDFGTIGTSISSYFTWNFIINTGTFSGGGSNDSAILLFSRNGGGVWMIMTANSIKFTIGTVADYALTNLSFSTNTIYNLTYVIDNNTWRMYVNGSLGGTNGISTNRSQSDNVYKIGVVLNSNGTIRGDNSYTTFHAVSHYDRALSASEVLQNYNALKNRFV